jgi:hypothetical protein
MTEIKINKTVRLSPSQIKRVEKAGKDFSELIREAIDEKLSRVNLENKEFNFLLREIKKIDPLAMHSDMKDLLLNTQIVFEETKKQNEVLKLLLNRVSMSVNFSKKLISNDDAVSIKALIDKRHATEIQELGI